MRADRKDSCKSERERERERGRGGGGGVCRGGLLVCALWKQSKHEKGFPLHGY